ncbi:glycoside hydrolase family 25 protein [Bradyrhizobium sp. dw_78]|uniref:glycoside hydrolase family 25 protein n=1 Tax=Bradyrhizobium sp. dw_78 TaxID=2719793 RepID=UPI001BD36E08|nr:glycoside hydrolase family 25 protein [Bradyrhizobium sp. dw_78]
MSSINLKVIDVSHYNPITSFQNIYDAGIRGIIHKATQGQSYADPSYATARAGSLAAGHLWGAYHFGDDSDPVTQAQHFVSIADPDAETLMALDFEPNGNSTMTLDGARAFMQETEKLIGRDCVLYSGNLIKETLGNDVDPYFSARRLWLAEYGPKAIVPAAWAKPGAWLWQFSDGVVNRNGLSVPGVSGKVDMNSYAGSDDELAMAWAGEVLDGYSPAPAPASPSLISRVESYFTGKG